MTRNNGKRGFTLVELGVVLAVIAVLSLVLISARFFIESAKIGSAVQMVNSVRTASRAYAKRVCGGIGFGGAGCAAPGAVSIANLQAQSLVPGPPAGAMCSPWCAGCNPPVICGVGVIPAAPANTNIRIGVCAPNDAATRADIISALSQVGTAGAGGPCGACPGGTACIGVTTR